MHELRLHFLSLQRKTIIDDASILLIYGKDVHMFTIKEYTAEQLQDPFGLLLGERYEFHLYIEVEEDDELYTGNDLALRLVYIKGEDNTSIAQTHFYEVSTNKVLDFDLEEEEEEAVKEFCGKHLPSEEGTNNEE